MKRFTLALLAGVALSTTSAAPKPYVLENTEVRDVKAPGLNREYQIFVSLPPSYATSSRSYPVVFVTDATYAFPLIRSIARRVGDKPPGLEEFVLVGLSYAKGDTPTFSRNRDYTPVPRTAKNVTSDIPGRAAAYGEGDGYRRFLASEVLPLVAKNYRVDAHRKIFIGHSYGSLLGLDILFKEPGMFDYYVLGSPSLWYEKGVMFEREKAYAALHRDLKARVYLGVGGLERPTRTHPSDDDMVGGMLRFQSTLKSRHYPGLAMDSRVFESEDHLTVAPRIITAGLKWALPKR
ncbi:alpha/beta hydrolase [Massilia horti]|uniref:Alpha/beta hydrolase n=1 Tax=Massilia horti TaxID=2562153 RepID=A0A4Y9T433_9BURK|nr:alpha/beta hydrolase-fold protein [Massilia horti]TFW32325.1 alpha/beta hydrolase [Massilia horti]